MTAPLLHTPRSLYELVSRYDGRAPRYTSYPTAVQFTPTVDVATYRQWLTALPVDEPISIYLHIPFCARLCWYCGCNTRAVNRHDPIEAYVGKLVEEIRMVAAALPARMPVSAVHLGGGTPNMLSPRDMDRLFGALDQAFALQPDLEVAAELDPAVLTREWVAAAAGHGLRRASLGVQNLAPAVQAAVDRHESIDEIARCVEWLRAENIKSINFDLMYGLPHQNRPNTLATIEAILPLRPERIALFGYAHVPWMKPHQKLIDEAALPSAPSRLDQSEAAAERLQEAGYVRIGLDHFALPTDPMAVALGEGRLRRNFQGYTTDAARTLIGMGASAIGAFPQGFVQNQTKELEWRDAVDAGDLPIARGVALTDEDRYRGEIIERLRCDLAVDLDRVAAAHGRDWADLAPQLAELEPFVADGLVELDGPRLTVTPDGRLIVRAVAALFDTYFQPESGRHSRTL